MDEFKRPDQFSRIGMLIGDDGVEKLKSASVAVFGLGGVGSFAAEALARSGIGSFLLVDGDKVEVTNINRQLVATCETIGQEKTSVMEKRIKSVNPEACVKAMTIFYGEDNADQVDLSGFSYVVDAIDTVSAKLALAERAIGSGIPIISSMGAGNRISSAGMEVADISETSVCPLAKVMRKELRGRGIEHLKVVYTKAPYLTPKRDGNALPQSDAPGRPIKRRVPGSIIFAPATAGILMAEEVIRDLLMH